jgi:hypothetical protein
LLFGVWPALSISNPNLHTALKEGSPTTLAGTRSMLVVFQVAISLVLLVIAGLTVRSLLGLMMVDPGFNPERLLTMRLNIPPARVGGGRGYAGFYQQLSDRIRNVPGVESVGVSSPKRIKFCLPPIS